MLYLGWIVAAFLAGVIITLALMAWQEKRITLRERFEGLGLTLGKAYAETAAAVKVSPRMMEARPDGQTLRTWQEGHYTISLLFDSQDYCLGVLEERD